MTTENNPRFSDAEVHAHMNQRVARSVELMAVIYHMAYCTKALIDINVPLFVQGACEDLNVTPVSFAVMKEAYNVILERNNEQS